MVASLVMPIAASCVRCGPRILKPFDGQMAETQRKLGLGKTLLVGFIRRHDAHRVTTKVGDCYSRCTSQFGHGDEFANLGFIEGRSSASGNRVAKNRKPMAF